MPYYIWIQASSIDSKFNYLNKSHTLPQNIAIMWYIRTKIDQISKKEKKKFKNAGTKVKFVYTP